MKVMLKFGNAVLQRLANAKIVIYNQGERFRLHFGSISFRAGISALISM